MSTLLFVMLCRHFCNDDRQDREDRAEYHGEFRQECVHTAGFAAEYLVCTAADGTAHTCAFTGL